jgi:hypothetical protein
MCKHEEVNGITGAFSSTKDKRFDLIPNSTPSENISTGIKEGKLDDQVRQGP